MVEGGVAKVETERAQGGRVGLAGVGQGVTEGQNAPEMVSEPSGGPRKGQEPLKWTPNGPPNCP